MRACYYPALFSGLPPLAAKVEGRRFDGRRPDRRNLAAADAGSRRLLLRDVLAPDEQFVGSAAASVGSGGGGQRGMPLCGRVAVNLNYTASSGHAESIASGSAAFGTC